MNADDRRDFEHLGERLEDQRRYFERVVEDMQQRTDLALAEARRATDKADASADRRFDSVFEFRQTLADQTAGFLTRREYDARHDALVTGVTANTDRISRLEGLIRGYSALAVLVALAVSILSHFVR